VRRGDGPSTLRSRRRSKERQTLILHSTDAVTSSQGCSPLGCARQRTAQQPSASEYVTVAVERRTTLGFLGPELSEQLAQGCQQVLRRVEMGAAPRAQVLDAPREGSARALGLAAELDDECLPGRQGRLRCTPCPLLFHAPDGCTGSGGSPEDQTKLRGNPE